MYRISIYLFLLHAPFTHMKNDAFEIISVKSQKESICGAYELYSRFKIKPDDKGFIVQKFTRREKVTDCKDQKTHMNSVTYYEAWPALTPKNRQQNLSDIWQGPENLATAGEIAIETEAGLFNVKKLPDDMIQHNALTNAGSLYSGFEKPSFWPAKNLIKSKARIKWDCCSSASAQTQVNTIRFHY